MLMICGISLIQGGLSMELGLGGAIHAGKVHELETQRKLVGAVAKREAVAIHLFVS